MKNNPICFGAGLLALDVILNGSPATLPKLSAGGSCGNVLSILGYFGWESRPIARLANDGAAIEILNDLKRWQIPVDNISVNDQGSTPIIIHRIIKDKTGAPIHRFEFKDPETNSWLPSFKAITKDVAAKVINQNNNSNVFYFDRMNPGTLELAIHLKSRGAVIYFEPSSVKDIAQFEKFLSIADIVKYSCDRIPDYKERFGSLRCFLEIETRGTEGLLYRCRNNPNADTWKSIKAYSIDNVQDAAGAGDWCTSGIVYQLCSTGTVGLFNAASERIEEALYFGQALGALNCLYDGARGLMYHYEAKDLIDLTRRFVFGQKVSENILSKSPRIDITTHKKFSELLKTNVL